MRRTVYPIADKTDGKKLPEFLRQEGQSLLPTVETITEAEMAVGELIEVTSRAAIEAVLTLSAQQVAGPKHLGKEVGEITSYDRQKMTILNQRYTDFQSWFSSG